MHPVLARQADGLHPAVLRMIDRPSGRPRRPATGSASAAAIAGDPKGAVILTGLGVSELSVSIPSIAAVKAQIRGLSMDKARKLAERARTCRNAAEVRALA